MGSSGQTQGRTTRIQALAAHSLSKVGWIAVEIPQLHGGWQWQWPCKERRGLQWQQHSGQH